MAQTKILLDSNSYFRLARHIRPLLNQEFGGDNRFCLYVITELEREFLKNPRLQRKFHWVDEPEYRENRSRKIQVSRKQRREIDQAFDYLSNHARTEGLSVSPVDVRALAIAYVLQVRAVTDDRDMLALAEAFEIQTLKTLALMKLMLDMAHIDVKKVRQIVSYWKYDKDLPGNFREDFQEYFGPSVQPPF